MWASPRLRRGVPGLLREAAAADCLRNRYSLLSRLVLSRIRGRISPAKATWRCSRRCPPPTALPALMSRSWILVEAGQQASKPVCRRPRSENSHGRLPADSGSEPLRKVGAADTRNCACSGGWFCGLLAGGAVVGPLASGSSTAVPGVCFTPPKGTGLGASARAGERHYYRLCGILDQLRPLWRHARSARIGGIIDRKSVV